MSASPSTEALADHDDQPWARPLLFSRSSLPWASGIPSLGLSVLTKQICDSVKGEVKEDGDVGGRQ